MEQVMPLSISPDLFFCLVGGLGFVIGLFFPQLNFAASWFAVPHVQLPGLAKITSEIINIENTHQSYAGAKHAADSHHPTVVSENT